MNGYLLDSDWMIDFLRGRPDIAVDFARLAAEPLFTSVISYSEVWEGVLYSQYPERDRAAFDQLLQLVQVLPVDRPIGEQFADLRGRLRRAGQPLDNFDLLIAATALHHDLVLLTRNVAHFQRVERLAINQFPAVNG